MAGFGGGSRPMGGYPALGALQGRMGGGLGMPTRRPPQTNASQMPQTNAAPRPTGEGFRPPQPPMGPPGMPPMGGFNPGFPGLSNFGEGAANAGAAGAMFNLLPQGTEEAFGFAPQGFTQRLRRPPGRF